MSVHRLSDISRTVCEMARIDIRLSEAEKALVADAAKSAGLTISEHVRRLALGEVSVEERLDDLDGRLVALEGMVGA